MLHWGMTSKATSPGFDMAPSISAIVTLIPQSVKPLVVRWQSLYKIVFIWYIHWTYHMRMYFFVSSIPRPLLTTGVLRQPYSVRDALFHHFPAWHHHQGDSQVNRAIQVGLQKKQQSPRVSSA
jgi:hypothetical protein